MKKPIMGATGIIVYEEGGQVKKWGVGCLMRHPTIQPDTPATMKEHLKRWRPGTKFLGVQFIPDDPTERRNPQDERD